MIGIQNRRNKTTTMVCESNMAEPKQNITIVGQIHEQQSGNEQLTLFLVPSSIKQINRLQVT